MWKTLKTHELNIPLWLIPMLYVGVTVACGLVFPRLEQEYLAAYSHGMSVASAQATLSAIASGMMALTGIVFALAFVMVQFSAIAYSPRLVAWFGRDPVLFHSLGLFTATFFYALATLAWIDRGGNGRVPLFSSRARDGAADPQHDGFRQAGAAAERYSDHQRAPFRRPARARGDSGDVPAPGYGRGRRAGVVANRGRGGPAAPGHPDAALLGRAVYGRSIPDRRPGPAGPGGRCRDRDGVRRRRHADRRHPAVARAWRPAAAGGDPAPAGDSGGAGTHLRAGPQVSPAAVGGHRHQGPLPRHQRSDHGGPGPRPDRRPLAPPRPARARRRLREGRPGRLCVWSSRRPPGRTT